jgi:hypothetical protein
LHSKLCPQTPLDTPKPAGSVGKKHSQLHNCPEGREPGGHIPVAGLAVEMHPPKTVAFEGIFLFKHLLVASSKMNVP